MLSQLKIYAIGLLTITTGIFAFLLQNQKLKAKTLELKATKIVAEVNRDVSKILANRNITEVLDRVDKEILNGDLSSLDR